MFGLETALVVVPIATSAISAGASVGAAAIQADATKYAARQTARSQLEIALAQERVLISAQDAELELQRTKSQESTTNVRSLLVAALVVGVAAWAVSR